MNNKVLIAFATKCGATEDTANQIANTLTDTYRLEVDLVNLHQKPSPNISQYGTIIIASGIRMKNWYKEAENFLKNDFQGKNIALFISSMYEAGKPETYHNAVDKYLENISKQHLNVKPFAMEAFGGRMKFLGRVTQDNRDSQKITAWSNNIGKKNMR